MGQNPHLDVEVKLTVHLLMALLLYHAERTLKSVFKLVNWPASCLQRACEGTGAATPVDIFGLILHKYT